MSTKSPVAKVNNGYSRTVVTRHGFRSKGIGAEWDARPCDAPA
jgi:hypothetical protein